MDDEKTKVIENVEDLESCYPQLVSRIRDEEIEKIVALPIKKIRKEFPDLVRRIAAGIGPGKRKADLSKPGFLLGEFRLGERGRTDLNEGDPFSPGSLRTFERLKGVTGLELPIILPFKDPFTRPTLENYVLRAEGGGDYERAAIARKALEKCV